jgi:CheY-like chemotaxis protein
MPGGGDIYIRGENVTLDEDAARFFGTKPGNYVKVSVTDTGVGIDEDTQQRIFEPFFTTKEMGRGTGLGLASAYGIIENHGGIINVYSKKGQGTTFNIYLPVKAGLVSQPNAEETDKEIRRGHETVLIVDDEDIITDVGRKMLNKMGYKVLLANSGKAGVEAYRKHRDEIDLVILDMIMPDMGGGEAYDTLKEINPDVIVLLSSGYSMDGQASEILERGCDGFIQKPFNMSQLSQAIQKTLDT